jgi:hypothetical protein
MARHLGQPPFPLEPRVPLDRAGCLAELRDVLAYLRCVLQPGRPGQDLPPGVPEKVDGTIEDKRIWLKGKRYRLTPGLRDLLRFLLANPGIAEEDVIRQFGMSESSHLHKRLNDLRKKLGVEMKKSGWRLQIKAEETHIYWDWRESK